MTLAAATALLKTAMLILVVVNANPQLSGDARDALISVATEAVSEVTRELASQASAQIGSLSATSTSLAVGVAVEPGLLVVTPNRGIAPLEVAFSGTKHITGIQYGDGSSCSTYTGVGCYDSDDELKPHVYQKSGKYRVTATHSTPGGVVGEVIVTVLPRNFDTCPILIHSLEPGDSDATKGGEVTKLQKFLIAHGYDEGQHVTGYFDGSGTLTNLMRFQMNHDIGGIGIVGPKTRALITSMCSEED